MKQNHDKVLKYYKFFLVLFMLNIRYMNVNAQTHQDCISAITVCTNNYLQSTASTGFGNVQEVSPGATCIGNGETNSTWYIFSIQNPGTLLFQVNPLNVQDDYDFILYKFNGDCAGIVNGTTPVLRCNYSSAAGTTGLAPGFSGINVSSNGANQCAPVNALQYEKYLLMVNNFTATNAGYELNFSGSATIYDTDPPSLTNITITSCSPSFATIYFSESIKVASISPDGSDFVITGPSAVPIISAVPLSSGNTLLTPCIKIYFTNPITVPGIYTLHIKNGSDTNTVSDFCDNMMPVDSKINFSSLYTVPVTSVSSVTNANCNNNDGTATAFVSAGAPPYNYNWNSAPPQQTLTASNLAPGSYRFVATDAHGCIAHSNAVITAIGIPLLTGTAIPETCDSMNNGSATVSVSGGVQPYIFLWNTNPSQSTPTATGLSAGSYTVIVTGTDGCTAAITVNVPLAGLPLIDIIHTNMSCNGSVLGSAIATVSGHLPFTYLWSNGATTASVFGLAQGFYILTVTDASGCTNTATLHITKGGMQLSIFAVNLVCENIHNGSATVTAGQAIAPLSYLWNTNPPQNFSAAVNLSEGSWTVIVTDSQGCKDSLTTVITGPSPLIATITTVSAGCMFSNGSTTVSVSGGNSPYTYAWNTAPVQQTTSASNLAAGAYEVTITDTDNCSVIAAAYIGNWDGPHGFISNVTDATCSIANGSATVSNITGNAPFYFLWYTNPFQYGVTSTGLGAGTFTVKLTDSEACLSFLNVKINALEAPVLILNHLVNASCGQTDGGAEVTDRGGMAPFTFEWLTTPLQSGPTASGLGPGIYLAVITDATGCEDSLYVTIPQNKAHNDFTFTNSCSNEPAFFDGITDYAGAVIWRWSFGDLASGEQDTGHQQNAVHIFSSPANFKITLYIDGGCATDTLTKSLNESVKPEAAFVFRPDNPLATAAVNFNYSGTPVNNWKWDFGDAYVSYEPDPIHIFERSGAFPVLLYVTDEGGCMDTLLETINVDDAPALFIPDGFTPNDDGVNDTFIILSHGMLTCDIKIFKPLGSSGLLFW